MHTGTADSFARHSCGYYLILDCTSAVAERCHWRNVSSPTVGVGSRYYQGGRYWVFSGKACSCQLARPHGVAGLAGRAIELRCSG